MEDICGDLEDLIGSELLLCEEVVNVGVNPPYLPDRYWENSYTWTFYKFSTIKGSVTIRWYGASTGFYSESVSFEQIAEYEE